MQTDMDMSLLTLFACQRLRDRNDFKVLVEGPYVQVVNIVEVPQRELNGFIIAAEAQITSGGLEEVIVCLPIDVQVEGHYSGSTDIRAVEPGSIIKIQRMLRLPDFSLLVHTIEIYSSTDHLTLNVTNLEADLRRERRLRVEAENKLGPLLNVKLTPELLDQFVKMLLKLVEVADETTISSPSSPNNNCHH